MDQHRHVTFYFINEIISYVTDTKHNQLLPKPNTLLNYEKKDATLIETLYSYTNERLYDELSIVKRCY